MIIQPAKSIQGEISLPGDKSISHRAAIIASMAEGESRIENYSTGDDCASTLRCLRQLGVDIEQDGPTVVIKGVGKTGLEAPDEPLDCGNSGTTMRLLAGVLAGQNFDSVLTGDESLLRRPMARVAEPLKLMGSAVETTDGTPPIKISGRRLRGIRYAVPVASAQIKSCILLAGLNAAGETCVTEPSPTRDHTERMLRHFGAVTESTPDAIRHCVSGTAELKHHDLAIPADVSAAAFFAVAAVCLPGSEIKMRSVGVNPSRAGILYNLQGFGGKLELKFGDKSSYEPTAEITVTGGFLPATQNGYFTFEGDVVAALIDELPILAVLGSQHPNGIHVRDARELRVKETDRIAAIVENLRRMNADVEEFEDGFRVGRSDLKGTEIDSFGDHRIAMAFAIAGLLADGETVIKDPECVDISFPGFFETLESVVQR